MIQCSGSSKVCLPTFLDETAAAVSVQTFFSGKSHHGAAWPGDTGLLDRAATALRCSFGAAPSEVVAAGGRGGGGSAAQSIGKGSNATLAARWLAAGSSVAYGRGRSGRSDITGMRRIITFGVARKKLEILKCE